MHLSPKHMLELEMEFGRELFKVIDAYRLRLKVEGETDSGEGITSALAVLVQTVAAGGIAFDLPESVIHEMVNIAYSRAHKMKPSAMARVQRMRADD